MSNQSSLLCFDRDVAELCGINAALLVKYVECSVLGKHQRKTEGRHYMWNPRSTIAEELPLTADQLRAAATQAEQAGFIVVRPNLHYDKTNHVLFYAFVDERGFFESRTKAKKMWMRPDELLSHGACAAVLLHSFRYWAEQNSTTEGSFFEGQHWHHDDLKRLAKVYQGLFTPRQIKDTVNRLVKAGRLLRRPCDTQNGRNRRRWYAVNDPPKPDAPVAVNVAAETLQKQGDSEARQIPNGSTSNPRSKHVKSQIHKTYVQKTYSLRAGLAALDQPSVVQPITNSTLRERPAVAPQAVGNCFNTKTKTGKETMTRKTNQNEDHLQKENRIPLPGQRSRAASTEPVTKLGGTIDPALGPTSVDQHPQEPKDQSRDQEPVDPAQSFSSAEAARGIKSVDNKYDTRYKRQIAEDREGNVRQTFAQCHQEVFGCTPAHGLGPARQVLTQAQSLGIPVRLFCLCSMASWGLTRPAQTFPSSSLIGLGAVEGVKMWMKSSQKKYGTAVEFYVGLIMGQNVVNDQVDWRKPEHPYKAILRHWGKEYQRWSEADFEADEKSIEAVIDWLAEEAPSARAPGRIAEAHPKLQEAFDLITLNFEVAQEPYATPQEFFRYYDDLKGRLRAELRRRQANYERNKRERSDALQRAGLRQQQCAPHTVAMGPSPAPSPERRRPPPPPPTPTLKTTEPEPTPRTRRPPPPPPTSPYTPFTPSPEEQEPVTASEEGEREPETVIVVSARRVSQDGEPLDEINKLWQEMCLEHGGKEPAPVFSPEQFTEIVMCSVSCRCDPNIYLALLAESFLSKNDRFPEPDEALCAENVKVAKFAAGTIWADFGKLSGDLIWAWFATKKIQFATKCKDADDLADALRAYLCGPADCGAEGSERLRARTSCVIACIDRKIKDLERCPEYPHSRTQGIQISIQVGDLREYRASLVQFGLAGEPGKAGTRTDESGKLKFGIEVVEDDGTEPVARLVAEGYDHQAVWDYFSQSHQILRHTYEDAKAWLDAKAKEPARPQESRHAQSP